MGEAMLQGSRAGRPFAGGECGYAGEVVVGVRERRVAIGGGGRGAGQKHAGQWRVGESKQARRGRAREKVEVGRTAGSGQRAGHGHYDLRPTTLRAASGASGEGPFPHSRTKTYTAPSSAVVPCTRSGLMRAGPPVDDRLARPRSAFHGCGCGCARSPLPACAKCLCLVVVVVAVESAGTRPLQLHYTTTTTSRDTMPPRRLLLGRALTGPAPAKGRRPLLPVPSVRHVARCHYCTWMQVIALLAGHVCLFFLPPLLFPSAGATRCAPWESRGSSGSSW